MDKIELLQSMLAADPENSRLQYLLALEYIAGGQQADANRLLETALKTADLDLSKAIMEKLSYPGEPQNGATDENPIAQPSTVPAVIPLPVAPLFSQPGRIPPAAGTRLKSLGEDDNIVQMPLTIEDGRAVKFSDVGGLEAVKKSISLKIIKPFLAPELFGQFRKKTGGGILLYGPPGCGKTFMARATAGECSAYFKPVHISDILDPYFGQSVINIHSAFVTARTKRPCVLFFDEIDALGYSRSKMHSDSMRPVVDQLLAEIEGVDSDNQRVLIIGATNTPWDVDPALRRPGRFDQSLFVPPPDAKARETIFKLKLMGRPIGPMNYNAFASMTQLHSGADIENIVETAAENVLEEIMKTGNRERRIESVDVENVISATRPSTIEWLRTVANYTKYANQSGFYDEVEQYMRENKRYF